MRAVVYRGVNDLCIETVPVPRIQSDELLVVACGVCPPTSRKSIRHRAAARIFGHNQRTISQVGARLKGFRIGERVARTITYLALTATLAVIAPSPVRAIQTQASLRVLSRQAAVTPNTFASWGLGSRAS
jgi:hypothetical protein